jgi:perosamine synthetase
MLPIPLCEPNMPGHEWQYVKESLDSNWLSGGAFLRKFEESMAAYTNARHAIGVSSGTTALHIALLTAGVRPNDLVIIPNLTFVATANAVKHLGAVPILMDIDPATWLIDTELLREFLSKNTALRDNQCVYMPTGQRVGAIVPVHILGNMPQMLPLLALAASYGISVVEDAAESLGSFQEGQHSGTFGVSGTVSFNSNKIITTAGGGMVLTNDDTVAKRIRHLITQAKASSLDYWHDDVGYNYRLVNPLAAIGLAQMEMLPQFVQRKKEIFSYYQTALSTLPLSFQQITPNTDSNFWHSVVSTSRSRELIQFMAEQRIETRPLWIPLNELPPYQNDIYVTQHHHSKEVSYSGVMLPCSTSISLEQLSFVCQTITSFFEK